MIKEWECSVNPWLDQGEKVKRMRKEEEGGRKEEKGQRKEEERGRKKREEGRKKKKYVLLAII